MRMSRESSLVNSELFSVQSMSWSRKQCAAERLRFCLSSRTGGDCRSPESPGPPNRTRRLRSLARARCARAPGHLLQTTALVNEAFLRLMRGGVLKRSLDHHYFFAAAGRAMRCILVDHARNRLAEARAGMKNRVALDDALDQMEGDGLPILELNEAIEELEHAHEAGQGHRFAVLRRMHDKGGQRLPRRVGMDCRTGFPNCAGLARAKLDNAF